MKVASIEHHVFLKFPPHSLSMMFSSWLKKKLELHLVAFCYTSELSFLHGAPVTFSGEWCKKSKTWAAGVFIVQFSSVTQLCLTLCDPGLQHTSLPCPSATLGACSNSCPLSR